VAAWFSGEAWLGVEEDCGPALGEGVADRVAWAPCEAGVRVLWEASEPEEVFMTSTSTDVATPEEEVCTGYWPPPEKWLSSASVEDGEEASLDILT